MSIIDAIILGFVQGVTEFLPISSSGHLVIFSHILSIKDSFTFDVLLNFGTLIALIVFYRHRIWSIIVRMFGGKEWKLIIKAIIATIPAVMVGLLFNDFVKNIHNSIWIVIATLIIVGVLMIIFGKENIKADDREIEESVGWKVAGFTGLSQAFALIPGVSRSGITMLAGLKNNLSAARAAEFSFLLAIPIIGGSCVQTLLMGGGISFIQNNLAVFVVGNLVSFAAGLISVGFLIKLVSKRGLKDFGWYRIILAFSLVILLLFGVL